jgi:DNA ligase-1
LVPIGKAEVAPSSTANRIGEFARDNKIRRFGPVREVAPTLLLEITFKDLQRSPRRKSRISMREPRIIGLPVAEPPDHIPTMAMLERLLPER